MPILWAATGADRSGVDRKRPRDHRRHRPHRRRRTGRRRGRRPPGRHPPPCACERPQPRLPARHGGPHRTSRPGPARQLLDVARAHVPLPRPPRRPTMSRRSPPSSRWRCSRPATRPIVEFHYLHHQPGGAPYDNIAEMAERIAAAATRPASASRSCPCIYQFGGCDRRPLGPGRSASAPIRTPSRASTRPRRRRSGACPPTRPSASRPTASAPSRRRTCRASPPLAPDGPIHMHLAEQVAEVAEVEAALGRRPVEWVLDHLAPDARFTPHPLHPDGAAGNRSPRPLRRHGRTLSDHRIEPRGRHLRRRPLALGAGAASRSGRTPTSASRCRRNCGRSNTPSASATAPARRSPRRRSRRGGASSTRSSPAAPPAAGRQTGAIRQGLLADLVTLDGGHVDLEGRRGRLDPRRLDLRRRRPDGAGRLVRRPPYGPRRAPRRARRDRSRLPRGSPRPEGRAVTIAADPQLAGRSGRGAPAYRGARLAARRPYPARDRPCPGVRMRAGHREPRAPGTRRGRSPRPPPQGRHSGGREPGAPRAVRHTRHPGRDRSAGTASADT